MVSLGFIKQSEQCPLGCTRVFFEAPPAGADSATQSRLAAHEVKGNQFWEICLYLAPNDLAPNTGWGKNAAQILLKLGLSCWWLDVQSLTQTLRQDVTQVLSAFGEAFWPHFSIDAVVYLSLHAQRNDIYPAVRDWEQQFSFVRFDDKLDLDLIQQQLEALEREKKSRGLFAFLRGNQRKK